MIVVDTLTDFTEADQVNSSVKELSPALLINEITEAGRKNTFIREKSPALLICEESKIAAASSLEADETHSDY